MSTQRKQIVEFIKQFPGRDDDEIAAALKISQRQTVNILCRKLFAEGILDRTIGLSGKLVNQLRIGHETLSSNSTLQAEIEIAPDPKRLPLQVQKLLDAGFYRVGHWKLDANTRLQIEGTAPAEKGVYAFSCATTVSYVGVAGMGLKKRLYFYGRPGVQQTTNIRINALIKASLLDSEAIEIYAATPPDFEWGGLTINGRAGLEIGLIESFILPWNVRGAA